MKLSYSIRNFLLSIVVGLSLSYAQVFAEDYIEITWEDLEVPGQGMEDVIRAFEDEINAIPEGDPRENEVMERLQIELNTAPVNLKMDGRKVKVPGFITPLETDKEGLVTEFLLVPYYGACIHVPPPPLNQTLYIKPKLKDAIRMEDIYKPVWVTGKLLVKTASTELTQAGYQILDAGVIEYKE